LILCSIISFFYCSDQNRTSEFISLYTAHEINLFFPVDFRMIVIYCAIQSMLCNIRTFYYDSMMITEVNRRWYECKYDRGEVKLPVHEGHHGLKENKGRGSEISEIPSLSIRLR
jgi:hypothetical protein